MIRATEQKEISIEYMFKACVRYFFVNKNGLWLNSLSIAETFKKYYFSLPENLVLKLLKPPTNFGMQLVNSYRKKWNLKERLLFAKIESNKEFRTLNNFDERKAPGIDDLSGIFQHANKWLSAELNNTAMKSVKFFREISWRLQNSKIKRTPRTTAHFLSYHLC